MGGERQSVRMRLTMVGGSLMEMLNERNVSCC